jgi:hypothetical protein
MDVIYNSNFGIHKLSCHDFFLVLIFHYHQFFKFFLINEFSLFFVLYWVVFVLFYFIFEFSMQTFKEKFEKQDLTNLVRYRSPLTFVRYYEKLCFKANQNKQRNNLSNTLSLMKNSEFCHIFCYFWNPHSSGPVHLRFWKLAQGAFGTSHDGANGLRDWSTFVWSSLFLKLVIYGHNVKFKSLRKVILEISSCEKWGKTSKNHQIHICGFHSTAKHMEALLKICTLFLVYSQIWLNLPRDDCHFSYI